jgi:transmembrane sensor
MEITNDLIQKFFENKCDPEEFEAVMEHLRLYPEQASRYLGMEEWNAKETFSEIPDHHRAEALEQLRRRLFPVNEPVRGSTSLLRHLSVPAIAASLLLVVAGMVLMTAKRKAAMPVASAGKQPPTQSSAAWMQKTNPTGKPMFCRLPDGSRVKLYGHSSLRYNDSFGIVRRESWVAGEADFTVQKNKGCPFTVFSGGLATTALGTSFGIKAASGGSEAIKLYEGRVVVRAAGSLKGWTKDVYLSPGQQLSYDSRRLLAILSRFPLATGDKGLAPVTSVRQDLVFDNSSLRHVFDQLAIQYHTKITWRARDIAGLNFTGTVPRTDSISNFLRLLATMNNLDIREQPAGFSVTKHKE